MPAKLLLISLMTSKYAFRFVLNTVPRCASKKAASDGSSLLYVAVIRSTTARTLSGLYQRCGFPPSATPTSSPTVNTLRVGEGLALASLVAQGSYPTPLMMTNWTAAMARPSAAVDSYSCGSASGLLMTLTTLACVPPSCSARLPQKFSAATTLMTDGSPGGSEPAGAVVAQADSTATDSAADNGTVAANRRRDREHMRITRNLRA